MKKISCMKNAEAAARAAEANNKAVIIVANENGEIEFQLIDDPTNNLTKQEV